MSFCETINRDCVSGSECPSRNSGRQCWETSGAACCRRNDKARCCFCSVYLGYLDGKAAGRFEPVCMGSKEPPAFAAMGKHFGMDSAAEMRV